MIENNVLLDNWEDIRERMPSHKQAQVIHYIKQFGPLGASEIALGFCISVQSANGILSACKSKGFLNRINVGDPTGGSMFEYTYRDKS